jgi:transposase
LRLQEQTVPKEDPDPKAVACYGLLLDEQDKVLLRFVDGRPVSGVTTQFLTWCCEKLEAQGKRALLLVWDNAGWHISQEVRRWRREHNREVKRTGQGVRILECRLPSQSPWLNPIEPKWGHAKRRVVEPTRPLRARELAERACAALSATYEPHLSLPNNTS